MPEDGLAALAAAVDRLRDELAEHTARLAALETQLDAAVVRLEASIAELQR